jgi:hypothetical protein
LSLEEVHDFIASKSATENEIELLYEHLLQKSGGRTLEDDFAFLKLLFSDFK